MDDPGGIDPLAEHECLFIDSPQIKNDFLRSEVRKNCETRTDSQVVEQLFILGLDLLVLQLGKQFLNIGDFVRKLAHRAKDALVANQKVKIAQLTFWFACLSKLSDVILLQLEVLELLVYEALPQVLFVRTLLGLVKAVTMLRQSCRLVSKAVVAQMPIVNFVVRARAPTNYVWLHFNKNKL